MIEHEFGSTIIHVCEDTARCIVYHPTDDNVDTLADYIDKNNYICAMIVGNSAAVLGLKAQVGGITTEDKTTISLFERQIC
tara:strand:- start:962 stop:1204 length:243 start_codon:yes stop_codon:yes gene_type:complete